MDTRFAYGIRESYPAPWQRVAHAVCGAKVTPVIKSRGRGVILSQRIRSAGRGDHGTSDVIRCAPDLILAQRERADG
jgi:hypothetical protein